MRIFLSLMFVGVIILPSTVNGQIDSASYSWEVLTKKGRDLYYQAEYDSALPYLEKAKLKALAKYGKDHANYASSLSNLADLYLDLGYAEAEPLKLESVRIMATVLGTENPDYATCLSRLSNFYIRMRNYSKAQQFLTESKDLREKILGKEHPDYETSLIDLAQLYGFYGYGTAEESTRIEELYIELRDIKAGAFGMGHPEYAHALSRLAGFYNGRGDSSRAESLYIEARDIIAKAVGQDHPEYAASLSDLARYYRWRDDYSRAEALYIESKDSWARAVGKEHPDYEAALSELADFYKDIGNYSRAEPLYMELKDVNAKLLGKESPEYAAYLNRLAKYFEDRRNYSKARELYAEAKDIFLKVPGKEHRDYVNSLHNLERLYIAIGNYSRAEELYIEEIGINLKVFGREHRDYASSLHHLADLYVAMGNYSRAEALYIESKDVRARVLGKENLDYASSLHNLGVLYVAMGNYSKAEELYIKANAIREFRQLGSDPSYPASMNDLAILYSRTGNYSKADTLYINAIRIWAKNFGKEHPGYATSLDGRASLYREMNNYSKAEALYIESIGIRSRVLGKEHPDYASSLNNLAVLYVAMGNYSRAEALYIESKDIRARVLGKEHPDYAASLNNLASLYRDMGNYSNAEPLYIETKDIRAKILGKEHPDYSTVLNNLASLYYGMGNYAKAEPLYLEATSQRLDQIARYFPSLSEKEKQDYYSANKSYFSTFEKFCLEWYTKSPAILSDLYNLKLATKGLLLQTTNKMRRHILNSKNDSLIQSFNDWQTKKNFLAKVYKMPPIERELKDIDEKKLEEEANAIEKSLSLSSAQFDKEVDKKHFKWDDIRKKLRRDEVAIEMVLTIKKIENRNNAVYVALIITPRSLTFPDIVVLENGDDLEGKFSKHYRLAVKQQITDEVSYNQFWKPIADRIKGAKKVYFSADGVYNQINLNTLYNPVTGKYVVDEIDVQIVTSTKELLTNTKTAKTEIRDATLFGHPNYNDHKNAVPDSSRALNFATPIMLAMKNDSSQRFFDGENISELPGTKVEVEAIGSLLKKKKITMHKYLFNDASEEEIKKLKNPQVLHIATHGFFLSEPNDNKQGFAGMETKKIKENPLLRSGLFFAGAKNAFDIRNRNPNGEDGMLTAYEAMSLDLNQTDLVVMSACETGLGVARNGEGVYGLQRAFQVAGAKSVLMSLWTVSDEATQHLMTMFYENWLRGKTSHEAFRMAQLSLRKRYPEPYYWGAFVQVGY